MRASTAPVSHRLLSGFVSSAARIPILLAIILVGLPLLIAPFDFWDGRILDHALDTEQTVGVHNWFFTSGWIIQYYIFSAIQFLDNNVGLSGSLLIHLIMIGSVCGVVYEAIRFYSTVTRLPQCWVMAAGIAVAVFPAWNVLLSSVTFIYVLCTWLVLLALRLIHRPETASIIAGIVLLIISFQLNSNFVFCIALGGAYLAGAYLHDRRLDRANISRFLTVFITAILAYIALKLTFISGGLYADYNSFKLPESTADLLHLGIEMVRYFQYPILIATVIGTTHMLLAAFMRLAHGKPSPARSTETLQSSKSVELVWPVVVSFFLIGAAAFPYVVVGKTADLRALLADWNPRHTFLMAMPVGLFLASFARLLYHGIRLNHSRLNIIPTAAALLILAVLLQAAFWHKLSRAAYEAGIIMALKHETPPQPGFVKIVAPQLPEARIRHYEGTWLMYQSYEKEDWLVDIVPTDKQAFYVPAWLDSKDGYSEAYQSKHIMRTFRHECETVLKITGEPYSFFQVAGWAALGFELPDRLLVLPISEYCEPS